MREDVYYVVEKIDTGRGYRVWSDPVSRHWTKHRAEAAAERLARQGREVVITSREHVGGGQYIHRSWDVDGKELSYRFE